MKDRLESGIEKVYVCVRIERVLKSVSMECVFNKFPNWLFSLSEFSVIYPAHFLALYCLFWLLILLKLFCYTQLFAILILYMAILVGAFFSLAIDISS